MASDQQYAYQTTQSEALFERATDVIPGGVSHTVRYGTPYPISIEQANGAVMTDVDGNEYVDFWNNHGAGILGHSPPAVVETVRDQVGKGIHFGAVNEPTIELAETIREFVPTAERVRFCCSGTEATMFAVRLARATTERDHILKVEGGWHGGNTDLTHAVRPPFDQPTTTGHPPGITDSVHSFILNDTKSFTELLEEYAGNVAGVIIDPRRGGIRPDPEFMAFLLDARDDYGFQLILDEVVSGCRFAPGSYQAKTGIHPDITTLGKIIGGGFPIGALCARAELFKNARPDRDVPIEDRLIVGGGTFSSHPTVARAGLATLRQLDDSVLTELEATAASLRSGIQDVFDDAGINASVLGESSLLQFAFDPDQPIRSPTDLALHTDGEKRREFQRGLLDRGFFFNPGSIGNVSTCITDAHIESFLAATTDVVSEMTT